MTVDELIDSISEPIPIIIVEPSGEETRFKHNDALSCSIAFGSFIIEKWTIAANLKQYSNGAIGFKPNHPNILKIYITDERSSRKPLESFKNRLFNITPYKLDDETTLKGLVNLASILNCDIVISNKHSDLTHQDLIHDGYYLCMPDQYTGTDESYFNRLNKVLSALVESSNPKLERCPCTTCENWVSNSNGDGKQCLHTHNIIKSQYIKNKKYPTVRQCSDYIKESIKNEYTKI